MTGQEFWTYLQQKIDKAYSAYLDNTKANSLIKETMYRFIDKLYHDLSFEKEGDELISLIIKDKSATPSAGICTLNASITTPTPPANEIPYYMHVMRVLGKYETSLAVTASGTTLTAVDHTLRKGSIIRNAGGTLFTVTRVNGNTFLAYSGSVYAQASGTYTVLVDREMKQMSSTRKAGSFHNANIVTPRYEFLNNGTSQNRTLRLTPAPATILIDYIRVPPLDINVADSSIELLGYYPQKFLFGLMDECVLNFGSQTKDQATRQIAMQDIMSNP
tara:strand:+ start:1356 stop:2180 length:825 start_codon:yes stop_codon:yes gene_type:complete